MQDHDTEAIIDIDPGGLKPLTLNPEDYAEDLAELDISDTQKLELLQTLWHIMKTFVDIGWGVDQVQYLLPSIFPVGNPKELTLTDAYFTANMLEQEQNIKTEGGIDE